MNIFVAKLNYATTDDGLRDAFEAFGEVTSAKVIMDRETGRSRGFGFVEMANDDEARTAIEDLDGSELDGREIAVKESEPREKRGGGGYGRGGGGGGYNRGGGGGGYNRGGGGGGGYNRGGGGGYGRSSYDRDRGSSYDRRDSGSRRDSRDNDSSYDDRY